MRRAVGLTSDELEIRERVFDGLTTRAIWRSLRALSFQTIMTAATELTLSAEPAPPNPTVSAGALGVVTTTWTQEVDDVLFPYVVQTFIDAAEDVHTTLPPDVPKITYDLAATYLTGAKNRLAGIGDVVWNDMRTQLALGYEAGESIQQLATRLRGVAKISEPHAQTIARTEVVPAANFGSLQQLKVAGFTDAECQKEWLATDDARTREAHRLTDGQRVGVNQPFVVDGDFLQVPGDPAGRPENVINCRCTVVYIFSDDEDAEDEPLTADARFEALHPRAEDGRFGTKSPFTILPKELRGKSGDGMYAPGMWGKYGAAGVMMRHVDARGTARYLLVQRANPGKNQWKWQLPGGALEEKETPAQGAAREAFEEIGATPELLASLTPRGEHAILRPVEGKRPWRYTNVVADSPTQFTPRVDRKEGELWKAVWLTEEQIREMMTRDRLVAPLAAEIDSILAKYDEPLVAAGGFNVITMTAGSPTVTDMDYYDLVTASKGEWTAADEAKVKRDSEGKFAKKAGLKKLAQAALAPAKPLHINTKVIYTTKYADGTVVAEKTLSSGVKQRLLWDAQIKKFVLQGHNPVVNDWVHVDSYTKKDAYAKFSKEFGWVEPHTPVPLAAPPRGYSGPPIVSSGQFEAAPLLEKIAWLKNVGPAELDVFSLHGLEKLEKIVNEMHQNNDLSDIDHQNALGKISGTKLKKTGSSATLPVAPSKTKTLLSQSPGALPAVGKPIHINTVTIYKTKYMDNAVIAEKTDASGEQRLVWDGKKKKFILQKIDGAMWVPQQEFNKDEAYEKFSKQTGWTQPVAPVSASEPVKTVSTLKKSVADMDETELLQWLDENADVLVNVGMTPTLDKALQKYPAAANKAAFLFVTTPKTSPAPGPSVAVPDFESDSAITITGFYSHLTQDDFDKLSASDQALIANEAPFYDTLAPASLKYSDKIKNFMAGTGDSDTVTQKFNQDIKNVSHLIAPAAFADWFDLHTQNVTTADWDQLDALQQQKLKMLAEEADMWGYAGPKQKIKEWQLGASATHADQTSVTYDWGDNSGPDNSTPIFYNGLLIAYAKSAADVSSAFLYVAQPDGSLGGYTGSVDFDVNETVESVIAALIDKNLLQTTGIPSTKSPAPVAAPSVPAAPIPTLTGSKFHVAVHKKIKKVGEIGIPNPPSKNPIYSVITPTQADKLQKSMFADSGAWNSEQLAAMQKYSTSVGYRSMNAVLRDDQSQLKLFSDAQLQDAVKHAVNMQKAMKPLPSSVQLFRGTGAHPFGQNTVAADFTKLKALEGKTLTDKGFISTTVDETKGVSYDYAKKPIQMIINTPKGTPAVYADIGVPGHSEHEITLAAGTSYRIDEVRKATTADKAKFGSGTEHVVVATVVPSPSASSSPINAPVTPAHAVAPVSLTAVAPSAPTAPTLGPIKASDLKKPMKITTKVIHVTKYQHGAVVAYRKDVGGLARLVWSDTTKKFILQKQDPDNGTWVNWTGHSKKDAYAEFAKGIAPWYEPPAGDSAIGSGGVFGTSSVAPNISTSGPTPSTAVTAPAGPPKPQPKFDVATLQALHGQIPADMSSAAQRATFDRFKKQSSVGFVTLTSTPEMLFTALHETLEKHNEDSKLSLVPKLNLLQLLKIIDDQSVKKANAIAKQNDANAVEITNTNAYENAIVSWLQTPAGAKFATDLLHPPAPVTVNGHVYKSKFSQDTLDTLAKIKSPGQIGTPDPKAKTFKTLTVNAAQAMQEKMLASKPWTGAQKAALKKYSTSYYGEMNPVIRDLTKDIKYMSDASKLLAAKTAVNIQDGMRPLPENVRVFRKTGASQFPGLTNSAKFDDIKKLEGKLFTDRAPLSTSVSSGTWSGNVHMTIDLPAGTPAAFIKSISANPSEDEMLLALGLNYRVVSVTAGSDGYTNVHLRVEA